MQCHVYFPVAMTVRSLFTYSSRHVNELEGRANDNPDDADVQADYLKVQYCIRNYGILVQLALFHTCKCCPSCFKL